MEHQEWNEAQRMEAEAHDAMLAQVRAELAKSYAQVVAWGSVSVLALSLAAKVVIG